MTAIDHLNYQILGGITAPHLRKPMLKRHHHTGEAALEYIVVGAIVVDFRALDTFGEIAVVAIAALGAYALLRGTRRARP